MSEDREDFSIGFTERMRELFVSEFLALERNLKLQGKTKELVKLKQDLGLLTTEDRFEYQLYKPTIADKRRNRIKIDPRTGKDVFGIRDYIRNRAEWRRGLVKK